MAAAAQAAPGPSSGERPVFDAVVLADSPHASTRVLGLSLVERGRRVAARVGARRVLVVDGARAAGELPEWYADGGAPALLIVRAGDQVVHPPLLEPLLRDGTAARRLAVGPDGAYAGAMWLDAGPAREAVAALARSADDAQLAEQVAGAAGAERIAHGEIARHAATTPAERRGAAKLLLRILVKAEDSPVSKYLYRPVSRPLTRLLVGTAVTPNQVSYAVGVLGLIGCWLTAQAGQRNLVLGAALVLLAGFIDGCDGEIARLRLTSSKFGAWLDTVVDEMTTTLYFVALGYHAYRHHPDQTWIAPSIAIGLVCYLASVYCIYYFLVVVSKTGNSQHYVGDLEIIDDAGGVGLRPRHKVSSAPPWVQQLGAVLLLLIRRDFINVAALAVALIDGYFPLYLAMLAGGVIAAITTAFEHQKLRRQLREVAQRGAVPRLVAP